MRGFRIGRILGIELRVDWSWVFIFLLLTWNLVAVFSRWHPDWTPVGACGVALGASLVFFVCVLLHELAHSLVARRYGVPVRSITLFLFGGVSLFEHEPPSARAEFFIAIVGPITSFLLGVGALALASAVTPISANDAQGVWNGLAGLGPLTTLLVWLGPINILIGLFNLVPGFPLDGGRVLRSIIWSITHDFRAATAWAATGGRAVGWLFIGAGIAMVFGARLPLFGTGLVSGIWLAFIGWFLHAAAMQSSTRLALDEALEGMSVEQLMRREGPVVAPDLSLAALVQEHLIPGDDRALPVVENGALVGLVSVSDLRSKGPSDWAATPVRAVMRPLEQLRVASPGQTLASAYEQLAAQDIGQMPVVVDGKLVGVLRRRDVTRWLEVAWKPSVGPMGRRPGARGPHATGSGRDVETRHWPPDAGAHGPA